MRIPTVKYGSFFFFRDGEKQVLFRHRPENRRKFNEKHIFFNKNGKKFGSYNFFTYFCNR